MRRQVYRLPALVLALSLVSLPVSAASILYGSATFNLPTVMTSPRGALSVTYDDGFVIQDQFVDSSLGWVTMLDTCFVSTGCHVQPHATAYNMGDGKGYLGVVAPAVAITAVGPYSGPTTMAGYYCYTGAFQFTYAGPCLSDTYSLDGTGTVTVDVGLHLFAPDHPLVGRYDIERITYTWEAPIQQDSAGQTVPVPEPGTLLLLSTGIAALVRGSRSRLRRYRPEKRA